MFNRRTFLASAVAVGAAGVIQPRAVARGARAPEIKALAFDAFPIFDPRAGFRALAEQFPERGEALRSAWFEKIFNYTWLRTTGNRYKDFHGVMRDALRFSTDSLGLELTAAKEDAILSAFRALPVWDDVKPVLTQLHDRGIRLGLLSNMTAGMLHANLEYNGLSGLFEHVLSTDLAQAFKPARSAYRLGVDAFLLDRREIGFVAFAGWDAAGADWFGYPTAWINRLGVATERLDATPRIMGSKLDLLHEFVAGH